MTIEFIPSDYNILLDHMSICLYVYIPGFLNVIADRPNQPITTEWSLHPEVINLIFNLWTPVVDMFATVHNLQLLQFMSPGPEPRTLVIDALSQDWQGWSMYMLPPSKSFRSSRQPRRAS